MKLTSSYLSWAGRVLALICMGYVGFALWNYRDSLVEATEELDVSFTQITFASVVWILGNASLAVGWARLAYLNEISLGAGRDVTVVMKTQIAKYLPGNIFHYAGRLFHYRKSGKVKDKSFAFVSELILQVGLSLLLGGVMILGLGWAWLVAFGVVGLTLFVVSLNRWKFSNGNKEWPFLVDFRGYLQASFYYAFTCIMMVVMVLIIVPHHLLNSISEWLSFNGAYLLSWLAGFITPGSPGGIGVREAVFVKFAPHLGAEHLVLIILLVRIASIVGDVLSYLLALILERTLLHRDAG